jgi:hypothetical protein
MDQAKARRAYIQANGLDAFAPEPFKQAEEHFSAATTAYGTDNDKARTELAAAAPLYEKTIADGFGKKVEAKRTAAADARTKADAEKAKVAAKEPYAAADASMTQAAADAKAGKFETAVTGYESAEKNFLESAKVAADRRVKAKNALDKAAAAMDETDTVVKTLEKEMSSEGGAQ